MYNHGVRRDRDGGSFYYTDARIGYANPRLRRRASALRADPGAAGAHVPADIPVSARSTDRSGGAQPLAGRGGAGEDLGRTPLRGADAVHADAAAHAPHTPRPRHEPADSDAYRGLLPAPPPGRPVPPRPWAADALELLRCLQAAVDAEDPRPSAPDGAHLVRHPRPGYGPHNLFQQHAAGARPRREAEHPSLRERPGVSSFGLKERQPGGVPGGGGPDAGRVRAPARRAGRDGGRYRAQAPLPGGTARGDQAKR